MEVLRLKDVLKQMDRRALLYVRYVTEKSYMVLSPTMIKYCTDELLNMPIGDLDAGDYALEGRNLNRIYGNMCKGKILICNAYREE